VRRGKTVKTPIRHSLRGWVGERVDNVGAGTSEAGPLDGAETVVHAVLFSVQDALDGRAP
jgi:hypothetical protein